VALVKPVEIVLLYMSVDKKKKKEEE